MGKGGQGQDRGPWAVGGGLMLGMGAGFIVLPHGALAFVGCLVGGLGVGLLVAALAGGPRN